VAGAGGGAPVHVGGPIVPPLPVLPADAPVVKDFPVGAPFGSVETLVRDGLPPQKYVLTTCVIVHLTSRGRCCTEHCCFPE
jgi:hypothetical protein